MDGNENQGGYAPTAEAGAAPQGANVPSAYWNQVVNSPPGGTSIAVPQAGNLWVLFEYSGNPPRQAGVWHQGGTFEPIQPGENVIAVGPGDMLSYQLIDPVNDSIKLGYQMI